MGGGSTYYNSSILMNVSSGNCAVATTKNQTSYVVTITNNVGNGGDLHGSSMFWYEVRRQYVSIPNKD